MKRVLFIIMALALMQLPAGAVDLENSNLELHVQSMKSGGNQYINTYTGVEQEEGDDFSFGFDAEESIYEYDFK